jgi:hypothetical protein
VSAWWALPAAAACLALAAWCWRQSNRAWDTAQRILRGEEEPRA